MLSSIRVVLVNPMYQENIGAVARAMKNMGITDLALVNPDEPPNDTARFRSMKAVDVVDNAKICSTLTEALDGVEVVFGTSSRVRRLPQRMLEARDGAKEIIKLTSEGKKIAILFGREDKGLCNEDLEKCNYHIYLDSSEDYPVLNVAQAVQVVCYTIFQESLVGFEKKEILHAHQKEMMELATLPSVENLRKEFEEILNLVGYDKAKNSLMHRRVRRFFSRVDWERQEVDLFCGIFKKIKKINKNDEK